LNQVRYSLIHREIETDGALQTAKELGITIVAYTPLGSGILSGKYHKNPALLEQKTDLRKMLLQRDIDRTRKLVTCMEDIALKYDATIAQVALNWVIHFNGDIVVTIPGATKTRQAQECAGTMNFVLNADELAKLDEISRKLMK
jgi:aryl-alcohol dehydrogenase-like predicted oxidoreductase